MGCRPGTRALFAFQPSILLVLIPSQGSHRCNGLSDTCSVRLGRSQFTVMVTATDSAIGHTEYRRDICAAHHRREGNLGTLLWCGQRPKKRPNLQQRICEHYDIQWPCPGDSKSGRTTSTGGDSDAWPSALAGSGGSVYILGRIALKSRAVPAGRTH